MRRLRPIRILLPIFLLALCASQAAGALSEAERRGKQIYEKGEGRHPITAYLPDNDIEVPGTAFTCSGCHLRGGAGQLEGGVQSADITWPTLTKKFSGKRPSGREHPPYDEVGLADAITDGVDPAMNELHAAHPHYTLAEEDLDDLIAYLKIMHREPVPGVSGTEVRVGMLLPSRGPLAGAGAAVRSLLEGQFGERNTQGGLYSRSLVLVPLPFDPGNEGAALEVARRAVSAEEVFCLLAPVGLSPEDEVFRYLEGEEVPVLVPLLSTPESGYHAGRYTYHVMPSIRDQARAMTDFVASRLGPGKGRVGLLYAEDSSGKGGAAGAREQAEKHALELGPEVAFSPAAFSAADAVSRLRGASIDAVLYFGGSREALAFSEEAERQVWRPLFLAPATLSGDALRGAPEGFLPSVFLAFPFEPPDAASPGMQAFLALGRKRGLGQDHRLFQALAYAGALVLEEGIKRSGRDLTREKLVASLSKIRAFETGVTPPLTYTPNRRSGSTGSVILGVDAVTRRLVPAAPWQEPQ